PAADDQLTQRGCDVGGGGTGAKDGGLVGPARSAQRHSRKSKAGRNDSQVVTSRSFHAGSLQRDRRAPAGGGRRQDSRAPACRVSRGDSSLGAAAVAQRRKAGRGPGLRGLERRQARLCESRRGYGEAGTVGESAQHLRGNGFRRFPRTSQAQFVNGGPAEWFRSLRTTTTTM